MALIGMCLKSVPQLAIWVRTVWCQGGERTKLASSIYEVLDGESVILSCGYPVWLGAAGLFEASELELSIYRTKSTVFVRLAFVLSPGLEHRRFALVPLP